MTATHRAHLGAAPAADTFLAGPGEPGLVTVVIPTYNREKLIGAAIDSVLRQSHKQLEIIVVDDGSTDRTRSVVEAYGHPVRYVYQRNQGVATARNTGFREATGEYIALLDSDDEWFPWKVEAQVRLLERFPEVGMVWTDMTAINEEGESLHDRYLRIFYNAHAWARIEEVCERVDALSVAWAEAPASLAATPIYKGDIFSRILLGNLVHTSTLLVRRTRLQKTGEIDVEFTPRGEDYEFHVGICSHGPVALIEASSMLYRIGAPDQLTAPHMGVYAARSNLRTVLRWLERGGARVRLPRQTVLDRLAQAYGWVGEAEMHYGEWKRARPHLWHSLRHRPAQRKALMLLLFSTMPIAVFHAALRLKKRLRQASVARTAALLGHMAMLGWIDPILDLAGDLGVTATIPI